MPISGWPICAPQASLDKEMALTLEKSEVSALRREPFHDRSARVIGTDLKRHELQEFAFPRHTILFKFREVNAKHCLIPIIPIASI
jgi:hypothetical protein